MATTLSRRRVAGAAVDNSDGDSGSAPARKPATGAGASLGAGGSSSGAQHDRIPSASSALQTANGSGNAANNSLNGASGSSHKVGYDPRDMDDQDEEKLIPKLTLMEEVLLLGLKDKQVSLLSYDSVSICY